MKQSKFICETVQEIEKVLNRKIMKIVIDSVSITEIVFVPDYNKITADLIRQATEAEGKIY